MLELRRIRPGGMTDDPMALVNPCVEMRIRIVDRVREAKR